ncbi:MAG TPA: hypothetical protein VHY76_12175 [Acetobacteraceae bacterium]|nr:hypothetical protein [Acetobacteraceae bacterium]
MLTPPHPRPATEQQARLQVRLLGAMDVRDADGRSLLPRQRRTRAVLAVLALAAPAPVRRDRLIALLWPRRETEQARASLRQALYELRQLLRPLGPDSIVSTPESVRLAAERLWVDARAAFRSGAPAPPLASDLAALEPAFDAWREAEHARLCEAMPPPPPPSSSLRRVGQITVGLLAPRVSGGALAAAFAEMLATETELALGRSRALALRPWLELPPQWAAATGPPDVVLDTAVHGVAGGLSVTLRLIDLRAGGELVWAQRAERAGEDGRDFAAEVAGSLAAQAEVQLLLREAATVLPAEPGAFRLLASAIPAFTRLERQEFLAAGARLRAAIDAAPDYAAAHAWLAWWHALLLGQGWAQNTARHVARAEALATRAVLLDPLDARALAIAGYVRSFIGHDPEDATALQERALVVDPNLPLAWALSGLNHAFRGEHEEAMRRLGHAKRLSPFDPLEFFFETALSVPSAMRGEFEQTLRHARAGLRLNPHHSSAHKGALVALGHLGRVEAARPIAAALLALEPDFSVRRAMARSPLLRPDDRDRYAEGLRRAGMPD